MIEQPLAGAIHQPQAAVGVEGEDGDVNLLDDFAQQRRGFERPQPLFAERRLQGVRLAKDFAERVVGSSAAVPGFIGSSPRVLGSGRQIINIALKVST